MTKKLQKYKYLIFDVDDTLLDFGKAFFTAQKNVATLLEVDYSDEFQKNDEKKCNVNNAKNCKLNKLEPSQRSVMFVLAFHMSPCQP